MATEVERVHSRCAACGMAVALVIRDQGLSDDGEPYLAVYAQSLPHSKADCDQMQRLQREQWPVLPFEGV